MFPAYAGYNHIKLQEVTCLSLCTANNFEEDALVVSIASLFHVSYLFSLFFFI
jgi:hypothetical protein